MARKIGTIGYNGGVNRPPRTPKPNIKPSGQGCPFFRNLVESIKEAGKIKRGEVEVSRIFKLGSEDG